MKDHHSKDIEELFSAILSLETEEECRAFFDDVCTVKELSDIAQRLRAAKLLKNGASYTEISRETGMSTATISRVNRCIKYNENGYVKAIKALERMDRKK